MIRSTFLSTAARHEIEGTRTEVTTKAEMPQTNGGTRDGCAGEQAKHRVLVMVMRLEETETRYGVPVLAKWRSWPEER